MAETLEGLCRWYLCFYYTLTVPHTVLISVQETFKDIGGKVGLTCD